MRETLHLTVNLFLSAFGLRFRDVFALHWRRPQHLRFRLTSSATSSVSTDVLRGIFAFYYIPRGIFAFH